MSAQNASIVATASTVLLGVAWLVANRNFRREKGVAVTDADSLPSIVGSEGDEDICDNSNSDSSINPLDLTVLPCIRNRRSIFPNGFKKNPPALDEGIIHSLLDAALYGPFHGKCYAGNQHPAKFVILGKESMVDMQLLTLDYYDVHWKDLGCWSSEEVYQSFRNCTQDEITGRWGPVSYMIAIVMRRQAGPKRFPEWEEAAAVACAVQNMHTQSTKFKHLACYWSSWHNAARDSMEMKKFLDMGDEDKCMGFFIVAQAKNPEFQVRRTRERSLLDVEWRL
mmetsp:Transcript_625/g.1365  ORF Transcript_625/g.1365 Transcript_625/m.1365 type:complete len:281 (-) Transcript_625:199-1041(-)